MVYRRERYLVIRPNTMQRALQDDNNKVGNIFKLVDNTSLEIN